LSCSEIYDIIYQNKYIYKSLIWYFIFLPISSLLDSSGGRIELWTPNTAMAEADLNFGLPPQLHPFDYTSFSSRRFSRSCLAVFDEFSLGYSDAFSCGFNEFAFLSDMLSYRHAVLYEYALGFWRVFSRTFWRYCHAVFDEFAFLSDIVTLLSCGFWRVCSFSRIFLRFFLRFYTSLLCFSRIFLRFFLRFLRVYAFSRIF